MILLAIAASLAAQTPADSTWRDHRRAASAAIARGDTAGWRTHTLSLQRLVGTTPRIAGGLATVSYALGDSAAGRRWEGNLNAMNAAVEPVDRSEVVFTLDDPDMIAEDLVYDAARHRLLVSSVHRGSIVAIDDHGKVTPFVTAGGTGVWGILGLAIDSARNTLWATTAAFPGTANYTAADSAKSALLEYDLTTGALRRRIAPADAGPHALGDLTVGADGAVYIGDGFGGGVYVLDRGAQSLRSLLAAGTLSSAQMPTLSADGRTLYVADYTFGIASINITSGKWQWLQHSDSLALTGIDGLYRVGADLVAVQNGLDPQRITRVAVQGNRVTKATPIVRGGNAIDLNHALLRGGELWFIAKAGWDRVGNDGAMKPGGKDDLPVVRRVAIPLYP